MFRALTPEAINICLELLVTIYTTITLWGTSDLLDIKNLTSENPEHQKMTDRSFPYIRSFCSHESHSGNRMSQGTCIRWVGRGAT